MRGNSLDCNLDSKIIWVFYVFCRRTKMIVHISFVQNQIASFVGTTDLISKYRLVGEIYFGKTTHD